MQTVEQSKAQIKGTIARYWSRYRWSQRQVKARPDNRFERDALTFNRLAVHYLIADYRRACNLALEGGGR